MNRSFHEQIEESIRLLQADYEKERLIDDTRRSAQPDPAQIRNLVEKCFQLAFLGFYPEADGPYRLYGKNSRLALLTEDFAFSLKKQIELALHFQSAKPRSEEEVLQHAEQITGAFLFRLPALRGMLMLDLEAAYDGDPAASCPEEILLAYPGFFAITISRFAHELFLLEVPLIPRMMTEYAHARTGIDIHPGASIGKRFFIDHGTGVVIGETTVIGDDVKLYQGVTLGALSTRGGQSLRGKRRHPTIGNHVTIYAGASILGGESVIGDNCVIASNAFLTHSVPAGSRISLGAQTV